MYKKIGWLLVITYTILYVTGCTHLLEAYKAQQPVNLTGEPEKDITTIVYLATGMLATLLSGLGIKKYNDRKNRR